MGRKILIIKLSALGDVLRTTPILRVLNGEITWITKKEAFPLLKTLSIKNLAQAKACDYHNRVAATFRLRKKGNSHSIRLIDIDNKNQLERLKKEKFDLVLSLDEDLKAARIASKIKTKKLIGVYLNPHPIAPQEVVPQYSGATPPSSAGRGWVYRTQYIGSDKSDHYNKLWKEGGEITYTNDSKKWFDTSLVSRFGIKKANELKKKNKLSYQEHLFEMLDKKFKGEEYILPIKPKKVNSWIIGIEKRVGEKWPAKQWAYYDQLIKKFQVPNYKFQIKILRRRKNLLNYIKDINDCSLIVCGDTLAIHLGIALKKKVVALFTCTSPQEIYDYGIMTKVVSPKLDKYFYKRNFAEEASDAISVNEVYNVIKKQIISSLKDAETN